MLLTLDLLREVLHKLPQMVVEEVLKPLNGRSVVVFGYTPPDVLALHLDPLLPSSDRVHQVGVVLVCVFIIEIVLVE